jgi:uncharacterized protein (TIGR02246 family)
MFRTALTVAVLLLAAAAQPALAQSHGAKIVDDAWVRAIEAGDVDALVALYAPNAVLYPPDAQEARGADAIRKTYADIFESVAISGVKLTAEYQTAGDVSVSYGLMTFKMTPRSGGQADTITVRVTAVAKQINGKWLYVADHASEPTRR